MKDQFLKFRVSQGTMDQLRIRAAESGQRITTFAREVLERDGEVIRQAEELAAIKSQLVELAIVVTQMATTDQRHSDLLREIRLFVRELAMDRNVQLVARVAAQLKTDNSI